MKTNTMKIPDTITAKVREFRQSVLLDSLAVEAFLEQALLDVRRETIAEERERVMGEIEKKRKNILWEKHNRLDINLDESKGYNQALDDLLSSLDPLTDKDI